MLGVKQPRPVQKRAKKDKRIQAMSEEFEDETEEDDDIEYSGSDSDMPSNSNHRTRDLNNINFTQMVRGYEYEERPNMTNACV
jgi:hypothetical protein